MGFWDGGGICWGNELLVIGYRSWSFLVWLSLWNVVMDDGYSMPQDSRQ